MIIAFSTGAGATAADGTGRNSPYTTAFLKNIDKPAEVRTVFQDIAAEAYRATGRKQLPELSISFYDEYFFKEPPSGSAPTPNLGSSQELDLLKKEFEDFKRSKEPNPDEKAWASISDTNSTAMLEEFIKQFASSVFAGYARARLAELQKREAELQEQRRREEAQKVALQTPAQDFDDHEPPEEPALSSPSFPCARASLAVEHTICNSSVLAALDRELSTLYVQRSGSRSVLNAQSSWLNRRNACGTNENCVEQRYHERIAELQGGGGSSAGRANPSFPCSKARQSAEIAICSSSLLADLDVQLNQLYLRVKGRSKHYAARQRSWVDRRNACGSDEACIEQRYREQIDYLQSVN
jgi:uncharacterized protein